MKLQTVTQVSWSGWPLDKQDSSLPNVCCFFRVSASVLAAGPVARMSCSSVDNKFTVTRADWAAAGLY